MTRDQIVNYLQRRTADEAEFRAADLLLQDRHEIDSLQATIARLHAVLTAAAEQRQDLNSPYDTGWNDAIRWINQHAAMAGGAK